ncbi:glycoside hydrolase family 75 protein [Streptomyces sp. VRA16 Mangrove soil]|uniref:glycoside hydrolase family 75 protein n=1 Tax=Streptomyces sp. VRA16 Mangrove soil TaxID=2817434 RepID=UPI0027DE1B48|nr:glycoside hydrolase family 75 protein [Streptomyces sp. VRA16 Mangrove soil]
MHPRLLLLTAACGVALLAPAALPAASAEPGPAAPQGPGVARSVREGGVRAADLLAAVRGCRQISAGRFRADDGARADIPVCGRGGAVYWKADLDIDCDGRPGRRCNRRTDPLFLDATAYQQSDGRQLSAERLPYVVVPGASRRWNPARSGVRGGTVAALVHRGRVLYAVVGDTGPSDIIGEASHAAARALGIDPDPVRGGTADEVTYILFPGVTARPIESHAAAVTAGQAAAKKFLAAD